MTAHDPTEAALVWFALFFALMAVAVVWEWLAVRVARVRRRRCPLARARRQESAVDRSRFALRSTVRPL